LGGSLPALLEGFAERRFADGEVFFGDAVAASWSRPDAERRCLADAVLAFLDVRVMNCGHVFTGALKIAEEEFGDRARGAAPGEVAESRAHKTGELLTRIFMG
jgi:hypothetical protein